MSRHLAILFIPSGFLLIVALSMPCWGDERDAEEIRRLTAQVGLLRAQVKSLQETVKAQALVIAKLKAGEVVEPSDDPQPTSRPAETPTGPPKPKAKRFRDVREIISKVPRKIHPQPGNHWDDLRKTQFNEWAETHTADGTIELTLVISGWSQDTTKDGETVFTVRFESLPGCQRLGIKYSLKVGATFPADQIEKLLKRKPGDKIKVKGRIEKFEMKSSYTEREDTEKTDRHGRPLRDSDGNIRQRVVARWAKIDLALVDASIK